ncbi:MAG: polysaccharide biosynthesis protein, partial [Defluviitaleaceae bacterium]|nr:polysaccharide biosynthesis protein [Defluviitaleaceae bacterium]
MQKTTKSSSFLTQAFILAFAGLFVRVIGFLYRVPMTNMLGDKGNGIYGAGFNIYNFFLILSSAGLPAAISRMTSTRLALFRYKSAHKVFRTSLIYAMIGGFISSLMLFFGARFLSWVLNIPEAYYAIISLAPTVFIVAVMSVFRGYFQGMNNTLPTALSQVLEQIINAIFSIYLVFIFIGESLELAAAGGTAATGLGALGALLLIMFIYLTKRKTIKENIKNDETPYAIESSKTIAKELVRTAFPIIAGTAIYSLTSLIDTSMVTSRLLASGAFTESEATALFGQLTGKFVTLTNLPVAIASSMAVAIIPSISASIAIKDKKAANDKMNLAIRLAMIIS